MKTILLSVIGIGLIMVTGEAPSAMGQFLWTGSWVAVMAIAALILNHLEKKEGKA